MWKLIGGVFIGWGLGSNDSANLFGTGVAANVIKLGKKIVELDGFSAFISEFSAAVIVHLFTQVGVPVSTSQAIVGGVTGVGLRKGAKTVSMRTLIEIAIGWVTTPLSSGLVTYFMMRLYLAYSGTRF